MLGSCDEAAAKGRHAVVQRPTNIGNNGSAITFTDGSSSAEYSATRFGRRWKGVVEGPTQTRNTFRCMMHTANGLAFCFCHGFSLAETR
uniref:Uncharacterized protein n=1 Tax=Rubinisphaera brasiliensis (strain ATCC 49424 / DSM 5305 / JCM 21570 / IAM 15109 / NBRC 103401 / IFAM 1448) TaxID=756272 RepID=F0SQL1_RUBBR|nr:hypothetical protein Plabr_0358 [Rubinisphaera brasiliensis DSM 5305]